MIVHPRGFTHDDRLHKFFLWNTIGQPLEEALAMASLIHEGILDAYPRAKIVISHGGGYLPFYSGRSDKAFESRPETRTHITDKPSVYMQRFFYDSVIFDQDMLARLVAKVGADRIMMGSDYPRGEIETDPVGFVSTAGLSGDNREKILSRNAMELFGIVARVNCSATARLLRQGTFPRRHKEPRCPLPTPSDFGFAASSSAWSRWASARSTTSRST